MIKKFDEYIKEDVKNIDDIFLKNIRLEDLTIKFDFIDKNRINVIFYSYYFHNSDFVLFYSKKANNIFCSRFIFNYELTKPDMKKMFKKYFKLKISQIIT